MSVSKASGLLTSTRKLAHLKTQFLHLSCTHYTSDYKKTDNVYPLVKYAADCVIVSMVNNVDGSGYLREINDFVQWCDDNFLQLNVTKTKELRVDFRLKQILPKAVCIKGEEVVRDDYLQIPGYCD